MRVRAWFADLLCACIQMLGVVKSKTANPPATTRVLTLHERYMRGFYVFRLPYKFKVKNDSLISVLKIKRNDKYHSVFYFVLYRLCFYYRFRLWHISREQCFKISSIYHFYFKQSIGNHMECIDFIGEQAHTLCKRRINY